MLTLYRPGDGWLHRMPAGPKTILILTAALGVSLLPSSWWAGITAVILLVVSYAVAGLGDGMLGMRELWKQLVTIRGVLLIIGLSQLLFLGPESAIANTARVTATILLAALLVLTTRITALLDAVERGLDPLRRIRLDPARAALLLTVTLTTIPAVMLLAREVREAQHARGARNGLRTFVIPFLVVTMKHADELGDALTARGVR